MWRSDEGVAPYRRSCRSKHLAMPKFTHKKALPRSGGLNSFLGIQNQNIRCNQAKTFSHAHIPGRNTAAASAVYRITIHLFDSY